MPSNDTTTKFRADISQLKSQMQAAARAVKVATSEFKAATAGLDDWSKSADGLQAKLKQLDTTLSSQNKQLSLMEEELEKTVKVYGENSAAADNVRIKINNQKAAIAQTQKQIQRYNQDLSDCKNGVGKFADEQNKAVTSSEKLRKTISDQEAELKELKKAYQDAKLDDNTEAAKEYAEAIKKLSSELNDNQRKLSEAENAADEFDNSLEEVGNSSKEISEGFTVMKGALASLVADGIRLAIDALKDLAKETYNAGANFESAMSQVEAVSGATAEEMEALTKKAEEMGAKTKFSATESAEAFNYMAMAGWKTEDMLGGIEGIMNLAAASGSDLATASDIVTDALTAMGYGAKDAGRLADVMAAASSNANTNVEMMGQTFQYAAPIVGALGYSMEDTAVAIGLMANAGIKGEKSGTALRSILTRLSAPPKECADAMEKLGVTLTDEAGNMKDLDDVMQDLRKAFAGLDETQKTANAKAIAGQEAMSGLLAIVSAAPSDYDKLTKAVQNSTGAAKDMADTMQNNVNGQLTLLKSKIEGIMIKIFDKASSSMVKGIHSIGDALDEVDWDKVGDNVGSFAKKAAELFNYIITNGPTIISILKTVGTTMAAIFVVNKIGSFIGWINKAVKAYTELNSIMALLKTTQLGLNAAQLASPIGLAVVAIAGLTAGYVALKKAQDEAIESEYGLTEAEKDLNSEINRTYEAQKNMIDARKESIESTTGEFNYIKQLKDEYNNLVDSNGDIKKGYEDRANFILNELANALGIEIETIKEEIEQNGKLSESIDELILKKQAESTLAAYDESYSEAKRNEAQLLQNVIDKQNDYNESKQTYADKQAEYNKVEKEMQDAMQYGAEFATGYSSKLSVLSKELETAKEANDKNKKALKEANTAYTDAQTTIKNYEGLSSAIISGDVTKINEELTKLTQGFKDAKSSTQKELEDQVKNYQKYYDDIKAAMESGNPVITQEMVDNAKDMLEKAQKELDKFPSQTSKSGENAGKAYAEGFTSTKDNAKSAGTTVASATIPGAESKNRSIKSSGITAGEEYASGISSTKDKAATAGTTVANNANSNLKADTNTSGRNFTSGFIGGMQATDLIGAVATAGALIARTAISALSRTQKEGSPSKITRQSGVYFGQGFENGIKERTKYVVSAATKMTTSALLAVSKTQEEGSPSKLTYQSGRWFTQGFINGIVSLQSTLVKKTKNMVKTVLSELLNLENFNFTEVTTNASTNFAKSLSNNLDYILNRINYQNQQMLADFDKTIEDLQEKSNLASEAESKSWENFQNIIQTKNEKRQENLQNQIDALEEITSNDRSEEQKAQLKLLKQQLKDEKERANKELSLAKQDGQNAVKKIQAYYDKQIKIQQDMKASYQEASQAMISEFTVAMSEYQTQAQKLINDTMNGISNTYQSQYDALINKQDNLINKLKSAGDLFKISSANVMTVNNIQAQTAAIKQYADKLRQIKEKVSSDLFDQIASYDMKEGEAFIDRLLAMSDKELQAYSDAYDEKMSVADKLSEDIYKSDFDKVASDYEKAVKQAFKNLPKELEELGMQTMEGFLSGLTSNTNYMTASVKTFIAGMVNTFKSELGIHSPSKVAMELGAYTGEGFADGLKDMINTVKKTAKQISDAVTSELDFSDSINVAKSATNTVSGINRSVGTYGANSSGSTTQVINFNQTNNSPKALDRLTIYRQTNNMLFSAKVRLSDV